MADRTETVPWSVAVHDTIPSVDFSLYPPEAHTYLLAFLRAAGEQYVPPYTAVTSAVAEVVQKAQTRQRRRQPATSEITPQRVRTWKAVFERFGFIVVDESDRTLHLTPLGRTIRSLHDDLAGEVSGANDRLAWLGVKVLSRHMLRSPLGALDYPEDSDIHPYRLVWRAMRQLDDKIHWEEMNRVLMRINYQRDEQPAISHIGEIRAAVEGIYSTGNVDRLGAPVVDQGDETKRRITPWLTQAGFGGLLITSDDDTFGFRHLVDRYKPLIDEALDQRVEPPVEALVSASAYLKYLTDISPHDEVPEEPSDALTISRIVSAVNRFGPNKIICLAGLPATGKSRLAKLAALKLTDEDPYRYMEVQFHEGTSYDDFVEGFVPRPSGSGFELKEKTLRIINRRAKGDPGKSRYVLLIEELTRANLHAVLGELMTYIEHRRRQFRFTYSQDEDSLAENLVILATFNPRDRSAITLDDAILRRLQQIQIDSSVEALRQMLDGKLAQDLLDELTDWFGRHIEQLPFGHGAFALARSADDLRDLWRGSLAFFLLDRSGQMREAYRDVAGDYPWQ